MLTVKSAADRQELKDDARRFRINFQLFLFLSIASEIIKSILQKIRFSTFPHRKNAEL